MLRLLRWLTRAAPPARQPSSPGFEAGSGGNRWLGVPSPAADPANVSLRQRSRHMAQNNAAIAAGVSALDSRCVRTGIVPTPQCPDPDIATLIAARFSRWSDRCDFDQLGDFGAVQSRTLRPTIVDGESLVETIIDGDELRLRIRNIDQLDSSMTRNLAGGYIQNGIEFDANGRKVAFHLFRDNLSYQTVRVPAEQICHVFRPMTPGQVRGVTWIAPVALPARELDQLHDALLVNAKVQSLHCGIIVDMNATGPLPYDGSQTDNLMDSSLEPGVLRVLRSGQDVRWSSPQQANSAIDLAKLTLKQIASGLGVPAHLIDFDLSQTNYSSLRGSLLEFKAKVEQVQYHMLIPMLLNPIYRKWLSLEVATGRIDIPGFEADPETWFAVSWLPPAFEMVDPEKDINAEVIAINNGLKSRTQAVAERGWDINQIDKEIQQDRKRETELGINFAPAAPVEKTTVTRHDDKGRIVEFIRRRADV